MDFDFQYTPHKLIDARISVEKKHSMVVKKPSTDLENRRLKQLIDQIIKLDKKEYKSFALKLTHENLYLLADYITENKYNVDITKIYDLLKTRDRRRYARIFFNNFKSLFTNRTFNRCLKDYIKTSENNDINMENGYLMQFINILESEDIVKSILVRYYNSEMSLEDYLKKYKFNSKSNLAVACRKAVFLYCDRQYYLKENADAIVDTVSGLDKKELILFINNYLSKLEASQLQIPVMNYLYQIVDKPSNKDKSHYWKYIDSDARKKYESWLKKKVLKDFFGGDARSRFWYNFIEIMDDYDIVKTRGQLFLDFGKFVVVEFKQTGNAAYIYSKEVFNNKYAKYVSEYNSISNNSLKDQVLAYDRIVHSGNWQYTATKTIRRALDDF